MLGIIFKCNCNFNGADLSRKIILKTIKQALTELFM